MNWFLLFLATACLYWGFSQTRSFKAAQAKIKDYAQRYEAAKAKIEDYAWRYKPAIDIDRHVQLGEERLLNLVDQGEQIQAEINTAEQDLARIKEELELASDAAFLSEIGYYEPRYDFESIDRYGQELTNIRDRQKEMLRVDGTTTTLNAAAYSTQSLTFNGSASQGRAAQKKTLKLILRAFNGESDSFIARVSYRNVDAMEKRIRASFESINTITQKYDFCELNPGYLDLRLQELQLVYEWEEAKQREKEEQSRIREQMREEEKAAREAEKAQQQAEKEETKYQELLQKAQLEIESASEKDKAKLNAKIEELQQRIAETEEKKRAISQAMLTKTGHVYIISNVGSFGENVYKIGMTRRLEPMDRVKELGDASVPFPFDVHAMIRTSDAPSLENALHKHFEVRRLNLENQRKEFFRVSIDEIRQELDQVKEQLGIDSKLRLTLLAEAKEYRMSQAKRKHLETTWQKDKS